MDVATVLKAVELVGAATPAALRLYEGFRPLLSLADQATLAEEYAAARSRSDAAHADVQRRFGAT